MPGKGLGIREKEYDLLYQLAIHVAPVDWQGKFGIPEDSGQDLIRALEAATDGNPTEIENNPTLVAYAREVVVDAYINDPRDTEETRTLRHLREVLASTAERSRYYWDRRRLRDPGISEGNVELFMGLSERPATPPSPPNRPSDTQRLLSLQSSGQPVEQMRNLDGTKVTFTPIPGTKNSVVVGVFKFDGERTDRTPTTQPFPAPSILINGSKVALTEVTRPNAKPGQWKYQWIGEALFRPSAEVTITRNENGQRGNLPHIERGSPAGRTDALSVKQAREQLSSRLGDFFLDRLTTDDFERSVREYLTSSLERTPREDDINQFLNKGLELLLQDDDDWDRDLVQEVVRRARDRGAFSKIRGGGAEIEARGREERMRLEARRPMGK